jgi:hypothetical protein
MKLRSGKTTYSDTPDTLIARFKAHFAKFETTPKENFPERVQLCYDIFALISDKLHLIDSPEFSPSTKFITAVYNKTYDMDYEHLYNALEDYISDHEPRGVRALCKKTNELQILIMKVREDIQTLHPELKPPSFDDDYEDNYCDHENCTCEYCMNGY